MAVKLGEAVVMMRFGRHFLAGILLAAGALSLRAYGQDEVSVPCPIYPEQPIFSVFCNSAQAALPDFLLWNKLPERIPGFDISSDSMKHPLDGTQSQPALLDELLCPKSCQVCGVIRDDQGTPIHLCTKG